MPHEKFDIRKLERLNDPARFEQLDPAVMWKALDRPDAQRIVEIGAGTGMFSARFAQMAPEAVVFAVDTEQAMIDWMAENRPEVASGHVVPVLSTESTVPLDDATADVVLMVNVHHELAEPAATYTEALRLLRPHGRLLVVDWAPIDTPGGPPQRVRASAEAIAAQLRDVGFDPVTVHPPLPWHSVVTADRPAGSLS